METKRVTRSMSRTMGKKAAASHKKCAAPHKKAAVPGKEAITSGEEAVAHGEEAVAPDKEAALIPKKPSYLQAHKKPRDSNLAKKESRPSPRFTNEEGDMMEAAHNAMMAGEPYDVIMQCKGGLRFTMHGQRLNY